MKASDKNILFIGVELYSNKKVNSFFVVPFPIATTQVYDILFEISIFSIIKLLSYNFPRFGNYQSVFLLAFIEHEKS